MKRRFGIVKWELDLWYEMWDRAGSQGLDTWYPIGGRTEQEGESHRGPSVDGLDATSYPSEPTEGGRG
jgi:hypothetical protein